MFRFLVLGLLRGGGSFHGYALMKEYRERSGLQLSTGNFGLAPVAQTPELSRCAAIPVAVLVIDRTQHVDG